MTTNSAVDPNRTAALLACEQSVRNGLRSDEVLRIAKARGVPLDELRRHLVSQGLRDPFDTTAQEAGRRQWTRFLLLAGILIVLAVIASQQSIIRNLDDLQRFSSESSRTARAWLGNFDESTWQNHQRLAKETLENTSQALSLLPAESIVPMLLLSDNPPDAVRQTLQRITPDQKLFQEWMELRRIAAIKVPVRSDLVTRLDAVEADKKTIDLAPTYKLALVEELTSANAKSKEEGAFLNRLWKLSNDAEHANITSERTPLEEIAERAASAQRNAALEAERNRRETAERARQTKLQEERRAAAAAEEEQRKSDAEMQKLIAKQQLERDQINSANAKAEADRIARENAEAEARKREVEAQNRQIAERKRMEEARLKKSADDAVSSGAFELFCGRESKEYHLSLQEAKKLSTVDQYRAQIALSKKREGASSVRAPGTSQQDFEAFRELTIRHPEVFLTAEKLRRMGFQ